jgi:LysM repeat protein
VHTWTKSACIVLACIIMPAVVVAAGRTGSVHPAQASTRTASSTEVILTSTLSAAAAPVTAARPAARYVVQPGDTLSGIAASLAVRGGWPALYAANRPRIGPDPDVIHPGTVLVLPGRKAPVRYRVVAGDTLAAIAAALAVRGGWPALYAANRRVIGPDPNAIRPGTVLTVARPAASSPVTPSPAGSAPRRPTPPPSASAGTGHRPPPARTGAPLAAGMPPWLKTLLLAAGLLIAAAFLAGPVLLIRRRRAAARVARPGMTDPGHVPGPGAGRPGAGKARIVLADHDQIVVTRSQPDGTVYVLRPPGAAPEEILRVARLVLPEDPYRELAGQLGMTASWPIVVADHDRIVVTRSQPDGTVYVLRPPGAAPEEILRVARLVLPEVPYGELADHLGVPASLPMDYMVPAQAGPADPGRRGGRGGGGGDRRGGGGRSRSVAGAIRPVLAAARVHPAGVAVPSAVLVTGIMLFTFVKSATIRVAPPPGSCGPGSVAAAAPSTGQPALPSSPEQNARSLTGSLEQIASPLPVLAAAPPAGPGRGPQVSRNPSPRLPGGDLVCDVRQVPSSAATAAAGSGG